MYSGMVDVAALTGDTRYVNAIDRIWANVDGKKLYIYGAGFEIEVYDAATLKYERTWDLNNDITGAGLIALP